MDESAKANLYTNNTVVSLLSTFCKLTVCFNLTRERSVMNKEHAAIVETYVPLMTISQFYYSPDKLCD